MSVGSSRELEVRAVRGAHAVVRADRVAVEEPLSIRVKDHGAPRELALTMRTPGEDAELAVGLLFAEGIVRRAEDVVATALGEGSVDVELAPGVSVPWERLGRAFVATSACGVCGKASASSLLPERAQFDEAGDVDAIDPSVIHALPEALRARQATFDATGGLHAAALFDRDGALLAAREDVGRHNAVDKLVGAALRAGWIPLRGRILFVSGRASFELLQKAWMAGASVLAAVGAPSSYAVELARETGTTLLGFVRDGRFNVYAGEERIRT